MDRAPCLARGDHPDRHAAHRRLSPSLSTPFRRQHHRQQPAHPAQPIVVQTERCSLPPCQPIRPVVGAPNLEAPCPLTGCSRGSVRARCLARGLMRWDGLGCSLFSPSASLSLSASANPASLACGRAVNEEQRKKSRAGQSRILGKASHVPQLLSYKHSNFQTFFLLCMSWARRPFSVVFY